MKIYAALIAASMASAPALAEAEPLPEGWTVIYEDSEGTVALRDKDWTKGRPHLSGVRVWARIENFNGNHPGVALFSINCPTEVITRLQLASFGPGGVRNNDMSRETFTAIPGTAGYEMMRWTCAHPKDFAQKAGGTGNE